MSFFPSGTAGRFATGDSGSATIEAVLWLPLFIAFLCLAADASLIFHGQNQAERVVQDANRRLSVGRLQTSDQVEDFVEASLVNMSPHATATTVIDSGVVTTRVVMPSADLVATGLLATLTSFNVTVGSQHLVEY